MTKIVISSGHGKFIRGAAGSPIPPCVDEVDEARKITDQVAAELRKMGVEVVTFHDNTSHDQGTNLNTIVNFHNKQTRDLDVSVHLNCYDKSAHGVEVLYVSQQALAADVSAAIAKHGFTDRGAKKRTDLAFLNGTNEPAVLIETFFCDNKGDCDLYHQRFAAICTSIAESLSGEQAQPGPTPPTEPELPPVRPPQPPVTSERRTLGKGDKGDDVAELQRALGVLVADGDFGGITETWVEAFQRACGLKADGVVGDITWDAVDDLNARVAMGGQRLPPKLVNQIVALAEQSEIQEYLWPDRGMSPPGWVAGMSLCFAYAMQQFAEGDDAATVMCKAQGSPDKDALAYLEKEFRQLGMSNKAAGITTLRHLWVLMIGLGMRESSGRYVEGRDLSASNVESETCEASALQTDWNIKAFSPTIEPLLDEFWRNPSDFREVFKLDVNPTSDNLNSYGSGDGVRYQWLSRFCPLFHICVSAVGLRTGRAHWGPVGRREVTLKKEADDLLKDVQALIESVA